VHPATCTRRLAISMKNSTYSCWSQTVSTVKKSTAMALLACARRNSHHDGPRRLPAGPRPSSRRTFRTVVFQAGLTAGGAGLFKGRDPIGDKIIATGDPLLGSSVTDLLFVRGGLNDAGELAFLAALADGRRVIVRASPIPAPSSKDDCKDDGWRRFIALSLRNQGDCVSWVNKHTR